MSPPLSRSQAIGPPSREHLTYKVSKLEQQLANIDARYEAVLQERDQVRRELGAMTRERDRALAAVDQPVYELLNELTSARYELEDNQRRRDQGLLEATTAARTAKEEARLAKAEVQRLEHEMEHMRLENSGLRDSIQVYSADLQEAQQRIVTLATSARTDGPSILSGMSARNRAIEAAYAAEQAAEEADNKGAQAYAAVASAWAAVDMLPDREGQ